MIHPLARDLLALDPSYDDGLIPPSVSSSDSEGYLSLSDATALLDAATVQFAGLQRQAEQRLTSWTNDVRGVATAIWENERVASETSPDALDNLIQAAHETVEGDGFSIEPDSAGEDPEPLDERFGF